MQIKTMQTRETTWADLKRAFQEGKIGEVLHSGDRIPVTLKNGEEVEFDFTYDSNGLPFFVMHDCMGAEHWIHRNMDDSRTLDTGETWADVRCWATSGMRQYLNDTVLPLLPDDLQEVIRPVPITQVIGGRTITVEDKMFLPSKTQVFGYGPWSSREPNDAPFDIFKCERDRDRVKECGASGTWWWWLRSPESSSGASFASVHNIGSSSGNYASGSYGVAPGFTL